MQKKKAPDYAATDTPTWLGELYACGAVGEMVADLERAGKRHAVITGVVEGGDPEVEYEIQSWPWFAWGLLPGWAPLILSRGDSETQGFPSPDRSVAAQPLSGREPQHGTRDI